MLNLPGYEAHQRLYENARLSVYRARAVAENSDAASTCKAIILKQLNPNHFSPDAVARFRQEYTIIQLLNPNCNLIATAKNTNITDPQQQTSISASYGSKYVVRACDLKLHEKTLIMILEDFGGDSLHSLFCHVNLEIIVFLKLAIQITQALNYIHHSQIIHKDINPNSIFLNPTTNELKIVDFSFATQLSETNLFPKNPEILEGTLAYMSPEQTGRTNRLLDYRTDFYSLGVTFYELLTQEVPFRAADPLELIHQHLAQNPPPLEDKRPDIPLVLSKLVLKLLNKNAEDRYQSAQGIQADLERCLRDIQANRSVQSFSLGAWDYSSRLKIPQKLYGREEAISTLLTTFNRVIVEEALEFVIVCGHAGIGKSVLVQEVDQLITQRKGYFITGKFDQRQRNVPYSAIADAFSDLVRLLLMENQAQLQACQAKLKQALGNSGQVIVDVIPDLELIIGPQAPVPSLEAVEAHNRFNLIFQRFVQVFDDPAHPLVIFLDDLQWADAASLELIQLMLRVRKSSASVSGQTQSHLFIGAYRNNEIGLTHPLMFMLKTLREEGFKQTTIMLTPLTLQHVQAMLADTFTCDTQTVADLADLVSTKTGGNPFFVREFLKTLVVEHLVFFDFNQRCWRWNIQQIQACEMTDNVVTLMTDKLEKLPQATQRLLCSAACLREKFDLKTLAIIERQPTAAIAQSLKAAIQAGLILTISEPDETLLIQTYRFLHDRVQQAAYGLMSDHQKQMQHLKIGQLLLQQETQSVTQPHERLFEIVDHLNLGQRQIADASFLLDLAHLNLAVARQSKQSTAYKAAHNYLCSGLNCLDKATGTAWNDHYSLILNLYQEQAKVAYLLGDFRQSQHRLETILAEANTVLDQAEAYNLLVVQSTIRTDYAQALEYGRQALQLLGFDFPKENFVTAFEYSYRDLQTQLGDRPLITLLDLPEIEQPEQRLAIKLLSNMGSAAYRFNQTVWQIVVVFSIRLFLKYGNSPASCYGYSNYGTLLGSVLQDYPASYESCRVSLKLSERYHNLTQKSRACFILSNFVHSWVKPVNAADAINQTGVQAGIESGELQYVGYTLSYRISNLFFQGKALDALTIDLQEALSFCQKVKNQWAIDALLGYQSAIATLRDPAQFPLDSTDEASYVRDCTAHKSFSGLCRYYILRAMLLYLSGDPHTALEYARQAKKLRSYILGVVSNATLNLYTSLILLQLHATASPQAQVAYRQEITELQLELQRWSQSCPENFLHKFWLVEAELARIDQHFWDACRLYDQAIAAALDQKFIQEEALANELAAKFWLSQDKPEFAQGYWYKARHAYELWGAKFKVQQLEQQYAQWLSPSTGTGVSNSLFTETQSVIASGAIDLDLQSLMKASQAITREIVLEKVLAQLMTVLMENAGAQSGYLILETDGQFYIEATGRVDVDEPPQVLVGLPVEGAVPVGLFNYVRHTRKSVVLHDAIATGDFTQDAYIRQHQTKSALCMPLILQGKLVGILYLENNLVTGAFTRERMQILNLLSTQVAISLKNAQLYTTLEQKVAERTMELQVAKETAELASQAKGRFLASMSHELRTPLNSILGFSQIMARDVTLAEPHQERLKLVHHSGEHLLDLINEILEFSKLEAGKQTLKETCFELRHLLETIEALFRLRIEQKGLQFSLEPAVDLPLQFVGDEKKICQILINLLSNAFKFTCQGHITLRIKSNAQSLYFEVEDTGEGIAADQLSKLFVPFEQTDSGVKTKTGTGLGLAISQQFAKLMGGEIAVKSQLKQGSIFSFTAHSQSSLAEVAPQRLEPMPLKDESNQLNSPSFTIVTEAEIAQVLSSMPSTWRNALDQAAKRLDGLKVVNLLSHPLLETHTNVAQYLLKLAENYDYRQLRTALKNIDL
ncbi:AAA family ATPase [Oscillatoria sp. CS-180]|uniref:hybrid sensor histidine kinase/response regulator n=1 Tax=Oscillatoria sp. CS-180 TaxID=3021720 RepID=UPI002331074E|nr:hybrid sensor histidine kinase/response regulator [Oscillatoria sp. CS-180]MDB9524604.1 AAA family ATPase [Oscillatoria sp. CS-180]